MGYTRIRGIGIRGGGGDGLYNAAAFMIFCYNFRAWEREIYIYALYPHEVLRIGSVYTETPSKVKTAVLSLLWSIACCVLLLLHK